MPTTAKTQPPQQLSVIIATHNRRDFLRRCLDSLAAQTQDPETFEVLVADDGSDDGTAEMVEALDTPFTLRFLRLAKIGHAAAQNAALEVASAPFCLLLDDDVVASPGLVAGHVAAFRDDPETIGIGALSQAPVAAKDWYAHAFARGWGEHYEELANREARWTDCYGANVSFPRQALLDLGGVSTDLPAAKDFDLAYRLYHAGCTPRYLPSAHGTHDDQKRFPKMLADARRQGQMHVELARRFPQAAATLLDWGAGAGPRELAVRRASITLCLPAKPLAWIGRFLPGDGRKMIWLHFVRRLAFWGGIRSALGHPEWDLVTHGRVAEAFPVGRHPNEEH